MLSSLNNNTPYKSALLATAKTIDVKRIKLAGDKLRKNMRYCFFLRRIVVYLCHGTVMAFSLSKSNVDAYNIHRLDIAGQRYFAGSPGVWAM